MKAGFFQFNPVFGNIEANTEHVVNRLHDEKFDLMVLPELFNTGYQFITHDEVAGLSEDIPGGFTTSALAGLSRSKSCYIVAGLAEKAPGKYFNSAVITGPDGFIGSYRKTHLFFEEKLWFSPGDTGFHVWDTDIGKIGVMICFDWFFPESARVLGLMGAEVIAHPSNLVMPHCPNGMPLRCLENSVYAITANRTGAENRHQDNRGFNYIGASQITGTGGEILYRASEEEEEIKVIGIDPSTARNKDLNRFNNIFRDRRPRLYNQLTKRFS
ncbi:(R)-stereoselective amidase [bacterium BMS3Abin07]|nr:(R)-stereoselective amidase [bacterium BMS3Abin07]GBE32036.1 (R)-stereoselective amidase [bacterium BMS3Bbin05]HDL20626.1 acyltransferase [Nitrospirota bacterium]HDO22302.1 acyltransferase [Nitrospirota bacterium]HDZ88648.1 acyltransferase [Nitrospirota bacterium]